MKKCKRIPQAARFDFILPEAYERPYQTGVENRIEGEERSGVSAQACFFVGDDGGKPQGAASVGMTAAPV